MIQHEDKDNKLHWFGHDLTIVQAWIRKNVWPSTTPNKRANSYTLKHCFEDSDNGYYLDTQEFNYAMLTCGFKPVNYQEINFYYTATISKGTTR